MLRTDAGRSRERQQRFDLRRRSRFGESLIGPSGDRLMFDRGSGCPANEAVVVRQVRPSYGDGLCVLLPVKGFEPVPSAVQFV